MDKTQEAAPDAAGIVLHQFHTAQGESIAAGLRVIAQHLGGKQLRDELVAAMNAPLRRFAQTQGIDLPRSAA